MSYPRLYSNEDFVELTPLLEELFNIGRIHDYVLLHSGFMSQNYRVNTDVGSFFLKRYRDRINTVIHEIKMAEEYFAEHSLPVILPKKDRYGREAFWCKAWYSIFPYIETKNLSRADLTEPLLVSLASTLAKFHEAGDQFTYRPFQMIRIGNKRKFLMENVELDRRLEQRVHLTSGEIQIQDLLSLKRSLFQQTRITPDKFHMRYDCLLHGDYQHFNVFADIDRVTHVFDLERTSLGPSSYEIARAIFMDCFEDGWKEKNFSDARLYLRTYRENRTLTLSEFSRAIRFYYYNIIHTSWIEANYLIYGVEQSLDVLARQKKRLEYLSSHNLEELAQKIWGDL
jgi:Ser/Thr protein kinase RdoA (MazF antagonist)